MALTRTVIVAGAGIGGLTASLTLAAQGFRVVVLEKAERLEEAGAGIQLSPNATRILLALGLGLHTAAGIVLGVLVVFATLEAALGFCAGCWAFGHLMRLGVISEDTCEACADITRRRPAVEEPVTTA